MERVLTEQKYEEMGFVHIGGNAVQDKNGHIFYPRKAKGPAKAIMYYCRECMGMDRRKKGMVENTALVADCSDPMCPLFDFRFGRNPNIVRSKVSPSEGSVGTFRGSNTDDQV